MRIEKLLITRCCYICPTLAVRIGSSSQSCAAGCAWAQKWCGRVWACGRVWDHIVLPLSTALPLCLHALRESKKPGAGHELLSHRKKTVKPNFWLVRLFPSRSEW